MLMLLREYSCGCPGNSAGQGNYPPEFPVFIVCHLLGIAAEYWKNPGRCCSPGRLQVLAEGVRFAALFSAGRKRLQDAILRGDIHGCAALQQLVIQLAA
jgi:hypothetical protein